MAEALGTAHAQGIAHRDLKPDNVFVLREPPGAVKVLDFGIAKLAATSTHASGSRTRTGTMLGTPLYMSPEQCRGAGTVDWRTDIYSLGCLLYEMLAGRPPFVFEGYGELIAAHMASAPESLTLHAPEAPASLVDLVHAMLAKSVDERPQSMADVVRGLGASGLEAGAASMTSTSKRALVATQVLPPEAMLPTPARLAAQAPAGVPTPGAARTPARIPTPHRLTPAAKWNPAPASLTTLGGVAAETYTGPASWYRRPALLIAGAGAVLALVAVVIVARQRSPSISAGQEKRAAEKTIASGPAKDPDTRKSAVAPETPPPGAEVGGPASRERVSDGQKTGAPSADVIKPAATAQLPSTAKAPATTRRHRRVLNLRIGSDPGDAEVCFEHDRVRLGKTQLDRAVNLPRRPVLLWVYRFGYRPERITIAPEVETLARTVRLKKLHQDDLKEPSPCE